MKVFGGTLVRGRSIEPAHVPVHLNEAFVIKTDADAAALINSIGTRHPELLARWVSTSPNKIDVSYRRYGGAKRLLRAIEILARDNPEDLIPLTAEDGAPDRENTTLPWMLLAMASGIRDVSVPMYDFLREVFEGMGTISFPSGRVVRAQGTGYFDGTRDSRFRMINYEEVVRKD
ncbi:MAG: hypothetical protein QG600_620 [Patescibacteria group bacterium]|nr:hypothetical protein [Patescibacteria group bacterium]